MSLLEASIESALTEIDLWTGQNVIERIKGGASGKTFCRITPFGDLESAVAVVFPDNDALGAFRRLHEAYYGHGLPVPRIFSVLPDKQLLFCEDFGDVALIDAFEGMDDVDRNSVYRKAIDLILQIQNLPHHATASWPVFDSNKYRFEYENHFLSNLIEFYFEFKPAGPELERLDRCMSELSARLLKVDTVPAHRDFQSSNLMMTSAGIGLVDFQDSLHAHPLYDLVSLLEDVYVDLPDLQKADLSAYYLERQRFPGLNEQVQAMYHLVVVQRKLHDAGAFARAFRLFGNRWFLPYINRAIDQAMASMEHFSFLQPIHDFLKLKVRRYDEEKQSPKDQVDLL